MTEARTVILCVDPDKGFLSSMENTLGGAFEVRTAPGGTAALEMARTMREVAVLVVNLAQPDMDGVELLARLAQALPDAGRVALMEQAACEDLSRVVNLAGVHGVLYKPVRPKDMADVLRRGVDFHKSRQQGQQDVQETLRGCAKVILDLLEVMDPPALSRSRRVRRRALELGKRLKAPSARDLDMAVMLSHMGCLVLPVELTRKLDSGRDLTPEEQKVFFRHPAIAAKLLSNIRLLDNVARIILHQNSKFSPEVPLESRILKAVLDLDRQERKGLQPAQCMEALRKRAGSYDPEVLSMLGELLEGGGGEICEVPLEGLEPGVVMARDLKNTEGTVLLLKGQCLTKASAARLKMFAQELQVTGPVAVVDGPISPCESDREADDPETEAPQGEARGEGGRDGEDKAASGS